MSVVRTAVFCDFDGTITRRDVGYNIFHHFSHGRTDELLPDWKAGRLTSRDCLLLEADMAEVTAEELYPFLDEFELDRGFKAFVERCREQAVDVVVVSDGLDLYINYVLRRFHLAHLPVLSNHAHLQGGRLVVEFPYQNHECRRCGNCKGERIAEYRRKHPQVREIVFVGDGYSDVCAVERADLLFAKKDLGEYCDRSNIAYQTYDDFLDVIRQLEKLRIIR